MVSLANNHAGDAGRDGLIESLEALRAAGIAAVGVGRNTEDACKPWRTVVNGVRIAVFGICEISTIVADDVRAGVAKLPEHADVLEIEIRRAKSAGEVVIVMIHGGDEYREQVNDEQRRWARWLVNCGVNLIVGAHPHVTQRTEYHGGAVIVHSLGNAVYPASLKGADSGELRTFQLTADGVIR